VRRWPLLAWLALAPVAAAQAGEELIQGLVIDSTISRFGHDFYRAFSDRLEDTTEMDFNLVVRERPSARWGSLIWVEQDQRVLYRQFLQPNNLRVTDSAYAAAEQVVEAIARRRLEDLLQDNTDMERDEL
jgi:curli production assembly/transport component CsgE